MFSSGASKQIAFTSLLFCIQQTVSYRILVVFPTASFSHQRPQIAVSRALAAHGHQLTIISPDPFDTDDPNIKQFSVRFLYDAFGKTVDQMAVTHTTFRSMFEKFKGIARGAMEKIFSHDEVVRLLNDER